MPPDASTAPRIETADEDYGELQRRNGGTRYRLDAAASQIRIYAYRGGRAAAAGHNHVLSAPRFDGEVYVPAKGYADARMRLHFRLDELVVDDPQLRADVGGSFAKPLDADAIAGTREHMLGADNFDAAHFPDVRIRSLAVTGEAPMLVLNCAVGLHGQTRELLLPVQVSLDAQHLTASGRFVLRQSDFGVRPYSVLGGLLAVQDAFVVEFTLRGEAVP